MIEYIYAYLFIAIFISPILFFFYIQSRVFIVTLISIVMGGYTKPAKPYRTISVRVHDYDEDKDY